jgi:hypothetical protein
MTEGEKNSGVLKKIWNAKGMSGDAKISMYEGIVVSTLLYDSEMWTASEEDRRRMGVMEMKCMRKIS